MTARAMRSFTEPIGLNDSTLTYTLTPGGASFCSFTSGVLPMVCQNVFVAGHASISFRKALSCDAGSSVAAGEVAGV